MTRQQISDALAKACGKSAGFAATAEHDAAVDALVAAHAKGVGFDPMSFISLIQLLLPLLQNNLPALIALLKQIFSPPAPVTP